MRLERARGRKENALLRQERDLQKNDGFLRSGDKAMKFGRIDAQKADMSRSNTPVLLRRCQYRRLLCMETWCAQSPPAE